MINGCNVDLVDKYQGIILEPYICGAKKFDNFKSNYFHHDHSCARETRDAR